MRYSHRRTLRFDTIEDALADARQLVAAEKAGALEHVGNWTLGQALGHVAAWADYPFDGYPTPIRVPLPVRLYLRLTLGRVLRRGLTPGVRLPGIPEGTLGVERLDADEGLRRLTGSLQRLGSVCPSTLDPAFGSLTHTQWIQLNLRHAELHMSFQVQRRGGTPEV